MTREELDSELEVADNEMQEADDLENLENAEEEEEFVHVEWAGFI